MKQLQNDFTTPEQSKRLLELGVPADSADMAAFTFFRQYNYKVLKHPYNIFIRDYVPYDLVKFYTPCWSVGRLFEIGRICTKIDPKHWWFTFWYEMQDNTEWAIKVLESSVRAENIDFSKLED